MSVTVGELCGLKKSGSGAVLDAVATGLSPLNAIPYVGNIANSVGGLAGVIHSGEKKDREAITKHSPAWSLLPGAGSYRMAQRSRGVADESKELGAKHPYANLVAEMIGPATSSIPGALLGSVIGANLAKGDTKALGALLGAVAGGIIPNTVGTLSAAVTKHRSSQEQVDKETSRRAIQKYLVPGMATYDSWKRYGRSRDWDKDYAKSNDKKDK